MLLADLPVMVRSLTEFEPVPDMIEDGDTCQANAQKKALIIAQHTGLLTLALVVQIVLGLSNVYWQIAATIAVPHNAGGALLLLVLVALNYYLFTASRGGQWLK